MRCSEEWQTFDAPWEELRRAVTHVADALPLMKPEWSKQGQVINGRMPWRLPETFLTGYTMLTVAIDKSGEVWVQSTTSSHNAFTDFGVNRRVVRRVMDAIEREVARKVP